MGWLSSIFGSSDKQTSSIPKYLENASKDLIKRGTTLLDKDKYEPYKGKLVADQNSYYGLASTALKGQRGLADENFSQADALLDKTKAGTANYYGDMDKALDRANPLNANYFSGANSAVNSLKALNGDYFGDADRSLQGIDRGASTYAKANGLLDAGSSKFMGGMSSADRQIQEAASRGGDTKSAMRSLDTLDDVVRGAQGRAEGTQLGTNRGLRTALGGEMIDSGSGYDESAGLTRKASKLDSTNTRAIQDRINPYTSTVTNNIMRDYNKERAIAGKGLTDSARAAGAFGGSRHGVAQGMFDQETSKQIGDISATQREKAYDAATGRLDADRGNLLSSAGQLSGTQQARDAGTLGFTGQIGDLAERDANLIRQGGLDLAGATKDAASGKMAGDKQLFDMDSATAQMYADLAKGYSNESQQMNAAKLAAQNQRFGQDMTFQDREQALAKARLDQQGQQFNQQAGIADRKTDIGKNLLNQQGQKFDQQMDIVSGRDALAKGQLGQEQQRFGQNMTLADMQRALGVEDQKSRQSYAADLLGFGKETRAIDQAKLDADKAQYDEKKNYDYEQMNWLSSLIGGQPYTRSTTQQKTNGVGNSIIGAITGGLGSFLSDENEKEGRSDADLEGILKSFRKMPVDDYDYKARAIDAGMAPEGRRTGPMAQDWAEEFGGTGKDIDVAQMLGKLAGAVKGLEQRTAEPQRGLPRRKAA